MKKLLFLLLLPMSAFANITMYTMDGCGYCQEARSYFRSKGLSFNECNIKNPKCNSEFERLGGEGTPLIILNGKKLDGFDRNQLDAILQSKRGLMREH